MRNTYLNGELDIAQSRGYDIIQLKYDGWWCRTTFAAGIAHYHSETGRDFAQSTSFKLDGCELVGEYMHGTQWSQRPEHKGKYYLYDIHKIFGESITTESYSDRYRLLKTLPLPDCFKLVQCYRITDHDAVWQRFVLHDGYEGIVFRKSSSTIDDAIIRHKREYTLEGTVVGFEPGMGKHEGRLGALRCAVGNGITKVGGGFTNDEREHIMQHQAAYLGRVCELTANAIFESGNLRHPRFVRWRDDKR